jgi:RND family efflux transporter MFP subunit
VSQVRPDIDLAALARAPAAIARPKRSIWRILLPALILLIFVGVLATSLRGVFDARKTVTLVRPRALSAMAGDAVRTAQPRVLLQAAGWIEPDPFPIEVVALTGGVVREVLALEAQPVRAGQVVAKLIDDDARLALAAAQAVVQAAEAELAGAERAAQIEATDFERALEVTEALHTLDAELKLAQAKVLESEAGLLQIEAQLRVDRDELALQKELQNNGATSQRVVDVAQARVESGAAGVKMSQAASESARAQVSVVVARLERAKADVELRLNDRLALSNADSALAKARAVLAKALVELDEAKLRMSRTEVLAPVDGIVLERRAVPGSRVDAGEDALICTLFDPEQLRVRVDVPQGDIGKLEVGARAEIASDSRANRPYHGVIVRLVQKADIQKVTLQVHVRIEDGDAWLRPEMLAQVRFLSSSDGASSSASGASDGEQVEVPARVVEQQKYLWIVDGVEGTAQRIEVELGATRGEWVEVLAGLDLSAKVIDQGRAQLEPGDRVRTQEQP